MNARVWQNLCGAFPLLMVGAALGIFMPEEFLARLITNVCFFLILILGIWGVILAILLVRGRLFMGCPICNQRSKVIYGTGKELYLHCPHCSLVTVKARMFRSSVVKKIIDNDDV